MSWPFKFKRAVRLAVSAAEKWSLGVAALLLPGPVFYAIASDTKIVGMAVAASKDPSSVGSYERLYELQKEMQREGKLSTKGGSRYAALHFADLHEENKKQLADNAFYFLMTVGSTWLVAWPSPQNRNYQAWTQRKYFAQNGPRMKNRGFTPRESLPAPPR